MRAQLPFFGVYPVANPEKKDKTVSVKLLAATAADLKDVAELEGKDPWEVVEEIIHTGLTSRVAKYRTEIDELRKMRAKRNALKAKVRERRDD